MVSLEGANSLGFLPCNNLAMVCHSKWFHHHLCWTLASSQCHNRTSLGTRSLHVLPTRRLDVATKTARVSATAHLASSLKLRRNSHQRWITPRRCTIIITTRWWAISWLTKLTISSSTAVLTITMFTKIVTDPVNLCHISRHPAARIDLNRTNHKIKV